MSMTIEDLISHYGYWAVTIGTLFEGETVVILAGFAAHRGYLDIYLVVFLAFVGSFLGDQFCFYLGWRYGERLLARWPRWRPGAARARSLLRRYDAAFIVGFRFAYGLRIISPFVIGMSGVDRIRFAALNLIAAAIWAAAMATAGFLFGHGLEVVLDEVKRYERYALAAIAAVGLVFWIRRWLRRRPPPDAGPRPDDAPPAAGN